jgi:cytochrome c oxidase subunit IV
MKAVHYSLLWFAMMLLTLMSYAIAKMGFEGQLFVGFVLVAAFIKGQIIIDAFMKLKWAAPLWRYIASCWLFTVSLAIMGLYFLKG